MPRLCNHILAAAVIGLAASTAAAQSPIKIGFMAELSGPQGALGQDQYDAFMLVVERNGGKLGGATLLCTGSFSLVPANWTALESGTCLEPKSRH